MINDTTLLRAKLRRRQLSKLRRLIDAQSSNQFYAKAIKQATVIAKNKTTDHFISAMPYTEKAQLINDQLLHPPYGTNLAYPLDHYKRLHQTSGTTSTPMRWLDTHESWQAILDCWKEIYRAAGVTHLDRICFAFSFGPFLGFWSAFEAATQYGSTAIPTGGMSSQARIKLILEMKVTVLCCTPTYAIHLVEVAKQANLPIRDSCISRIIVAGEPGGSIPSTRSLIETSWNAKVFDHHGMTEVGPISYQCPLRANILHILEGSYLPEIITVGTPKGNLNAIQEGELVITTLDRLGSPLLRYRTGDLVQVDYRPCPCGSPYLSLIGGIRGRCDDMLIVRGVNIYPSTIEELVRRFAAEAEYRVIIDRCSILPEICLQIELNADDEATHILIKMQQTVETSLAMRFKIEAVPIGSLPRHEMKAKRYTVLDY